MARSKREKIKLSPEQRLVEQWDQQVFFLQKQFPNARPLILGICKSHEKLQSGTGAAKKAAKIQSAIQSGEDPFKPTEAALQELTDLYTSLKSVKEPAAPPAN